uniref:histidine kinase n=1 Tax=Roseihalotalea indica TaxID=2867963 RepID=A0AA49JGA3_9BACT|nr:ATP-binding protein [Tunicatimonas sp. TK19036]
MSLPRDRRIDAINQVLLEIAEGNFQQLAPVSDNFDEIDAIASGINMLSEELRETVISRNYLNSVLRSIVDMLIIFDENFYIKQVNRKVCELLEKPESYFIDQPFDRLFDGRKAKFIRQLKNALQQQDYIYNIETSFKVPRKGKLPVALSLSTLKNNLSITGYVLIAKDLKQIQLTSKALKDKNEELKTFIYRVSHDLKGPLASMLGLFQVIEQTQTDLPTLEYYTSLIKQSALKLNTTLTGLLEIGITDRSKLVVQTFDAVKVIHDIIDSFHNYPHRERVDISLAVNSSVRFTSSEKLFRSILQNLIENGIKYQNLRSDNAFIKISAKFTRGGLDITVRDNGEGMEKQVLDRAFDMFYRGNQASSGSGLGLFIVKTNIEKLGGDLKIKSKPREGTELRIFLPSLDKF